ncbi:MAG: hypothetical protein AB7Y46_10735 [Armatimonadota bacterium]
MSGQPRRLDIGIATIVIIAGLLTGLLITYYVVIPRPQPRYSPEYPVVDSLAQAAELAEQDAAPDGPASSAAAAGAPDRPTTPLGAPRLDDIAAPLPPDDERKLIRETEESFELEGITETVELTEELYLRISARAVIMANLIAQNPEAYPDPKQTMLAFMRTQFVKERIDPEQYYKYTHWVSSDHDRALEYGERILRAAEREAKMRIEVSDVPEIPPAPVAPPED